MRILVIPDRLEICRGMEQSVSSLAKEWAKNHEVLIYSNAIGTAYQKELKACSLISGWKEVNDEYVIEKFKPDVIVAHPFSGISLGYRLREKIGCKLFVVMHNASSIGLCKEHIDKIEKVIAVSTIAKNAIRYIVPKEKLEVIFNGINTKQFYPTKKGTVLQRKLGIITDYHTIAAITRLSDGKEKPLEQLIRIAPNLAQKLNGINLLICGDGHFKNDLIKLSEKFTDNKLNLIFTGEVKNIRSYMNLSDLVLASDRTALEAILCNKKVFYMGQYKWKSLIRNNNYIDLIFNTTGQQIYTNEELTEQLTWMLLKDEELESQLNGLFENVTDECEISNVAKKYLNIFKGATENE